MKTAALILTFFSICLCVTPVKLYEIQEDATTRELRVSWAGDANFSPYSAKLIGDTANTLVKVEIYHIENGLLSSHNVPSKYNGERLNSTVFVGFTEGNSDPAFLYGERGVGYTNDRTYSNYLLDKNFNEIISLTGSYCWIGLESYNNKSYLKATTENNNLRNTTYYKLRDDITSVAQNPVVNKSDMNLSFVKNGKTATISNLTSDANLNIYNYNGRMVYTTPVSKNKNSVNLPAMAAGVYIGRVKASDGAVRTAPFVKN